MKILDAGSGPVPKLTSTYTEIEITHCDIRPFPGVDLQDMEKLTYKDNEFEMVICINALDHTKDAFAAVKELMRVGQCVYINCAINQMTRHRKKHYWDARPDGTFYNKTHHFDLKDVGFLIDFEDGRMIAKVCSASLFPQE